nr:hypothetical protein [Trueperella pyogenes]
MSTSRIHWSYPGVVHLVAEIIDRVLQASGILGSVFRIVAARRLVTELAERIIVGLKLFFQLVELGTALLSWICQFLVRESFSPNDAAEFSRPA